MLIPDDVHNLLEVGQHNANDEWTAVQGFKSPHVGRHPLLSRVPEDSDQEDKDDPVQRETS